MIVVDPGHGGTEPGTVGPAGLLEKAVNLNVGLKVEQYLQRAGFNVILTRRDDAEVRLMDRIKKANEARAVAFVSVHHNGDSNPAAQGLEVYYRSQCLQSRLLADLLRVETLLTTNRRDRGTKTRVTSQGQDYYTVLRWAEVPAVIWEGAFVTNPAEEALLREEWYLEKAALGLVAGIRRFVALTQQMALASARALQDTSVP